MSDSTSQNPAITYAAATGPSPFPSADPSPSSSSAFNSVGSYNSNSFRMKGDSSPYAYDEQAPRSQQSHANYTHHELGSGGLAQTQALGGFSGSSQYAAEPSRPAAGSHYSPQHTRHQSLNTSVGQLGLSNTGMSSNSSYGFNNDLNSTYGAHGGPSTSASSGARSPLGRPLQMGSETYPTRNRFPSSGGYSDSRPTVRLPSRTAGLGLGMVPGVDGESPKMRAQGLYPENSSPRSLKRPSDHIEDTRSPTEHATGLRRPASFPALGTGQGAYGRQMPMDARTAQTMGHGRGGRPGLAPGQGTPGRTASILPGGSYYEDGRRESFSSNPAIQSPVQYHGATSSSEELHGQYMGGPPPLMRSTQIPGASTVGMPSDPTYSPPSLGGAQRAKLELHGNLNDMAIGWSHEEWRTGRRLIQFWRRQDGSIIHTTFRPIVVSQYVPNSIVISCIFREDKNECYVTSVDTIYLLEALVASRFTVEEKNRIRRNLEGFRPMTVSKNKRECERFFKLIMSFPNPKPRNIEKDVKVFPWKVLSSALCKIIGKYSALDGSMTSPPDALSSDSSSSLVGLSGVDLTGHCREGDAPSSDYDRQVAYGAGVHPAVYGSGTPGGDFHARSRSTGSAMAFHEFMPNQGMSSYGGGSVPFPSQAESSYQGYESFNSQQQQQQQAVYTQPQQGGEDLEPPAPPGHQRNMSGSTLTAYYTDRRP